MTEVISSSSAESYQEKGKKKLPNLVKISDLKRSDSLGKLLMYYQKIKKTELLIFFIHLLCDVSLVLLDFTYVCYVSDLFSDYFIL